MLCSRDWGSMYRYLISLLSASAVLAGTSTDVLLNASPVQASASEKEKAYQRAKDIMPPDLYLVYRIADRITTANQIKRPVRVAVRRGVDCRATLGIDPQGAKCQALNLLPDVDKATSFDIWAAQVVETMRGSPNAFAHSDAGMMYVNIAMLKETAGKPHQLACVIGHELAHITQNHSEEKLKARAAFDAAAASKISRAVKNAHNAQNAERTFALIVSGVAAGFSGNNSSLYQTQYAIALQNMSAALQAPAIAQEALKHSPEIGEAIGAMQGLSEAYVKRTVPDIRNYLRDSSLSLMGVSRALEYEADLLGLEYVVAAGFNGGECAKFWAETKPHNQDKLIERLLPAGVVDPGVSVDRVSVEQQMQAARMAQEEAQNANSCRGTARECARESGNVSRRRESDQIPPEVLERLMSSHPSDPDRAKALSNHTSQKSLMMNLTAKGKSALASSYVRGWTYDAQSESVIIHDKMVHPKDAGAEKLGTTGIDIDKMLGF